MLSLPALYSARPAIASADYRDRAARAFHLPVSIQRRGDVSRCLRARQIPDESRLRAVPGAWELQPAR